MTWNPQSVSSLAHLNSVFFASPDTGWAVGDLGIIMETTNGGSTWTTQASNTVDGLRAVNFPTKNIGYAGGESGTILKIDKGTTNLDERELLESVLSVYPNPTTEKFAIHNKSNLPIETQIRIFNVIGNQVFNDKFRIQNFVEIPVSSFEAGIYLLEIQTDNGFVNSKLIVQ